MPIAGNEVGSEFVIVCKDKECESNCKDSDAKCKSACSAVKCKNIYTWLVRLHKFRVEYDICRSELAK